MSNSQSETSSETESVPDIVRAYNQLSEFALYVPDIGWISDGKVVYRSSEEYAIEQNLYCSTTHDLAKAAGNQIKP